MDGYVSKAQFAQIYGCSRPYISQLVKDKRLVLSEDGKQVNVEASLRLLDVSADPSKAGVRERWAAHREGRDFAGTATGVPEPQGGKGAAAEPEQLPIEAAAAAAAAAPKAPNHYHDARTLREQAQAQLAQIELAKAQGRALDGESTLRAIADVVTSARTEIMMFRDRLAPLVAPITDARKVYDLIEAECERLLEKLAARCEAAARDGAAQ